MSAADLAAYVNEENGSDHEVDQESNSGCDFEE